MNNTVTPITYNTNGREVLVNTRTAKIGMRIMQILNERGEGAYNIIVRLDENGQIWLIPPPPKEERIG